MSKPITVASLAAAALMLSMAPVPATAHTYDKTTYLTFSGPVQIPGGTLEGGTYRFRLANPDTSRNVLQVLSNDGSIVYAMFHTIPDSRNVVTEASTVTFRETPAGLPPAIRSLFYGGELNGYEFVYPNRGIDMSGWIAAGPEMTYTETPLSLMPAVAPEAPSAAPPEAFFPAPRFSFGPASSAPALELPRTASALPLVAMTGMGALMLGFAAALLRRLI